MAADTSIVALIRDADRGRLLPDIQEGLNKIVDAIEAARGAGEGTITLKLKVKCTSEGVYDLVPELTVKVPVPKRQGMLTFLDDSTGELIRRDPRQPDIPGLSTINGSRAGAD